MGSVWLAEHTALKTHVAVKLLHAKAEGNSELRARFLREARAAGALTSSHVVRVLDYGVDDDVPYIAMEYLEGESLRARLHKQRKLSPEATGQILRGVCRGIAKAHKLGVVHRDLKPDNIFLAADEEHGEVVKVVDFGIAKILEAEDPSGPSQTEDLSTSTGLMLGTPYYMSPEQLRGRKDVDARTDLWAIGVVAFECLLGQRPFVADAVGELVLTICTQPIPVPSAIGAVPDGFDAWFAKAMQIDPKDRFASVQELADGLAAVLTPGDRWLTTASVAAAASDPASSDAPAIVDGAASTILAPEAAEEASRAPSAAPTTNAAVTGAEHSIEGMAVSSRPQVSRAALAVGALLVVAAAAYGVSRMSTSAAPASAAATQAEARPTPSGSGSAGSAAATSSAPASGAGSIVSPAASSVAPATSVEITFASQPEGVKLFIAGKPVGAAPGPLPFANGSAEVTVEARAKGYVTSSITFVPDAPKTVAIKLAPVPQPKGTFD